MCSGDLDAGLYGEGHRGGRVGVLEREKGLGTVVEEVVGEDYAGTSHKRWN